MEAYNEHANELPELVEDDHVAIQNGEGSHPKRWDKLEECCGSYLFVSIK